MLTRRAVALAKIESTYNTDPTPVAATDALLVMEPQWTVDPTILQRNFVRNSLSPMAHKVGRKLAGMTFGVELRGGGSAAAAAKIGRLMRACGYSETQVTAGASQLQAVKAAQANAGATVAWSAPASGSAPTEPVLFTLTCVTGGPSLTATLSVTPDANAVANGYAAAIAATVVTSGSAFTLKAGVTITPTWTGNLTAGDKFYVWWMPVGYMYAPVSSAFESVTLYLYRDGVLHKLTGARGTFTVTAEAGQYSTVNFTFTGQYVAPTDAALPSTAIYETTLPPIVESANLTINEYAAVVAKISYDQGNQITPRMTVNGSDGYNGVQIVSREPKGGIDPEMALVASEDFWSRLSASTQQLLRFKVGNAVGNRVWMLAGGAQYTGLSYSDRDSTLVLDAGLAFPQWVNGDDEVYWFFG